MCISPLSWILVKSEGLWKYHKVETFFHFLDNRIITFCSNLIGERRGSVVECSTLDQGVAGSSLSITALRP